MKKIILINKINEIISNYGSFTTAEVLAEASPSVGNLKGINQLCETFYLKEAEVVTYDRNDNGIDSERMLYTKMKTETLKEILELAITWQNQGGV